jgi:hypothetical protein
MASRHEQFKNQNYINLETFRKSGEGVKTPVWFVQEGDSLYVRTEANSAKIKRIRNNNNVRVAACSAIGEVYGIWVDASAVLVNGEKADQVNRMLNRKYGLFKIFFDVRAKLLRLKGVPVTLRIDLRS